MNYSRRVSLRWSRDNFVHFFQESLAIKPETGDGKNETGETFKASSSFLCPVFAAHSKSAPLQIDRTKEAKDWLQLNYSSPASRDDFRLISFHTEKKSSS